MSTEANEKKSKSPTAQQRDDEPTRFMFSRAGKSTTSQYLAFQDPEKLAEIQSKVTAFMGKPAESTQQAPKKSPAEELKAAMDPK